MKALILKQACATLIVKGIKNMNLVHGKLIIVKRY